MATTKKTGGFKILGLLILGGGIVWAGNKYLLPILSQNNGIQQLRDNNVSNEEIPYGMPDDTPDSGSNAGNNDNAGKKTPEPPRPSPTPIPRKKPVNPGSVTQKNQTPVSPGLPQKKRERQIKKDVDIKPVSPSPVVTETPITTKRRVNPIQKQPVITTKKNVTETPSIVSATHRALPSTKRNVPDNTTDVNRNVSIPYRVPDNMVSNKKRPKAVVNRTTTTKVKHPIIQSGNRNDNRTNVLKNNTKQNKRFDNRYDFEQGIMSNKTIKGFGSILDDILSTFDVKHAVWLYSEQDIIDQSKINIKNINERTTETKDKCCKFTGDYGTPPKKINLRKIFY